MDCIKRLIALHITENWHELLVSGQGMEVRIPCGRGVCRENAGGFFSHLEVLLINVDFVVCKVL